MVEDWQRVGDIVRARGWPETFSADGDVVSTPESVAPIFELADHQTILWRFSPDPNVGVHCHFFAVDEIELDVDPKEIVGQEEFDAVCEVIRVIGQALGRSVDVTEDSGHSEVFMRYDASTDSLVRVPPPPTISLLDRLSGRG